MAFPLWDKEQYDVDFTCMPREIDTVSCKHDGWIHRAH